MEDIIKILPIDIKNVLINNKDIYKITELRLRVNKPLIIYIKKEEQVFDLNITSEHIISILKNISSGSIYSIQNELNRGYITINGGHRIGVAGEIVTLDGIVKNIKNISSLNIRVSHELIGASKDVMKYIIDNEKNVKNTLIVSKPYMGKTTVLRDIIRNLSNLGFNVSVIDERKELSGAYNGGVSGLDLGKRTDILTNLDKAYGIEMAIRSLNPDVICTDEIGNIEDILAIKRLSLSGVKFIVTMHGDSLEDVKLSRVNEILENGYLDNIIILGDKPGNIKKIYGDLNKDLNKDLNIKEKILCWF